MLAAVVSGTCHAINQWLYRGRAFPMALLMLAPTSAFLGGHGRITNVPRAAARQRAIAASTPGALDQDSTPLVDALAKAAANVRSPLFYPGHKMGSGAPGRFVDVILGGKLDALRHDLPELPELDNLFAPEGPIRDAELLAAEAFGASKTWLLTNGSTCGVIASILACVKWHNARESQRIGGGTTTEAIVARATAQPGSNAPLRRSVVILPRDAHKSAVHGLVLCGATPCFVEPIRHLDSGVSLGIGMAALNAALAEYGDEVAAVFLVSPTYEGACADIASAARACHLAGVPLIVDEAHGAHLAFLGEEGGQGHSSRGALQSGADMVVQSAHKTLGSLTQSAFLHLGEGVLSGANGDGAAVFSAERAVSDALGTVQSSSPSYLLLASLDAARWTLAGTEESGKRRLKAAVKVAQGVREQIAHIDGVQVLELEGESMQAAGFVGTDPLRLTVSFAGGVGGYEADEMLIEEFGVYAELPAPDSITFVFGPGSTVEHGKILTEALRYVGKEASRRPAQGDSATQRPALPSFRAVNLPRQICTPREAFFAESKAVKAREAIGLASAETVCPYPPGIPALLPGEAITQEALDILEAIKASGGVVSGCSDPTLATMRVVVSCVM